MEQATQDTALSGSDIYRRPVLSIYDPFVLGFSSRFAWKCRPETLVAMYDRYASAKHLDVGVGTGYFLDHCRFPVPNPSITLVDLNPSSLASAARRIDRYKPTVHAADIFQPLNLPEGKFDSIGLNYVLHCLAGDLKQKGTVLDNLAHSLTPGGVLFGATLLGVGVERNALARLIMGIYNRLGIFGNRADSLADLKTELERRFRVVDVQVQGCAAIFAASQPQ